MVKRIGSMALGAQERSEERAEALIADYLDLLESQSQQPGLHAYRELAEIGQHYDLILAVNFPEVSQKALSELSRLFGRRSPSDWSPPFQCVPSTSRGNGFRSGSRMPVSST